MKAVLAIVLSLTCLTSVGRADSSSAVDMRMDCVGKAGTDEITVYIVSWPSLLSGTGISYVGTSPSRVQVDRNFPSKPVLADEGGKALTFRDGTTRFHLTGDLDRVSNRTFRVTAPAQLTGTVHIDGLAIDVWNCHGQVRLAQAGAEQAAE